jgi:hypothetical protein
MNMGRTRKGPPESFVKYSTFFNQDGVLVQEKGEPVCIPSEEKEGDE